MKRIFTLTLTIISLFLFSFSLKKAGNAKVEGSTFFSDTVKCGTPEMDSLEFENLPWYDNNQYLEDFLDSINYPQPVNNNGPTTQDFANYPTRYWIPIKFWVPKENNGFWWCIS